MPDESTRVLQLPEGARMGPGAAEFQLVLLDGCVVMGWYGEVTPEGIDAWGKAIEQTIAQTEGRIGLVTCVRETSPPPDGDARKAVSRVMFHEQVGISLLIFEGSGFRAAIVRSVVAMLFAMGAKKDVPHKVTGDVKEGTQWFTEQSSGHSWQPTRGVLQQVAQALLGAT